jgi:hypothetical protein
MDGGRGDGPEPDVLLELVWIFLLVSAILFLGGQYGWFGGWTS